MAPILTLHLSDITKGREAVRQPALGQILCLWLDGGVDDATAEMLAASPYTRELRVIHMRDGTVTDRGFQALAASRNLPNLIALDLTNNPCAARLQETDGSYYWDGPMARPYRDRAFERQIENSTLWAQWPPTENEYAWIDDRDVT